MAALVGAVPGLLMVAAAATAATGGAYTVAAAVLALFGVAAGIAGITWTGYRKALTERLRGDNADLRARVEDRTQELADARAEAADVAEQLRAALQQLRQVRAENNILSAKITNQAAVDLMVRSMHTLLAEVADLQRAVKAILGEKGAAGDGGKPGG